MIPRGTFLAVAICLFLSVPLILIFDRDSRAIAFGPGSNHLLFGAFWKLAGKILLEGVVFLMVALLLGRTRWIGLSIAFVANAVLIFWFLKDAPQGKDWVIAAPLFASFICIVFDGYMTLASLKGYAA